MSYTLPADVDERPVAIDGAGTLGRRIAAVYLAGGTDVRIFDVSPDQREAARAYAAQHADDVQRRLGLDVPRAGEVEVAEDLEAAVRGAWMVVEAVPEKLELKRTVFGELDRLAEADAILASNSSSLATSRLIDNVRHPERVLNAHYQQPPELNAVELMSCGRTDEGVIAALTAKLPHYGLVPFHVRRESDGFIFNRIWAAIKRECLMVVEEDVASPEDVDGMWNIWVSAGLAPFEVMDRVGLDVVLDIEEHYASVRPGIPEGPRKLLRDYLEQGRLGVKTGHGFYDHPTSA
jgi:3-hydroxybutyryl-CoA dehydrogenase